MTLKILSIDYGIKHVGFAIGNSISKSSNTFFSLSYKGKIKLMKKIIEICDEWGINRIVFGMPYNIDGTMNKMCKEIEKFSKKLSLEIDIEIFFQDETLTSMEYKIDKRNNNLFLPEDSHGYAAKLTLESYLREQL